jgi:hypothetical protein
MSKYLELVEDSFNESHFTKQKNQNPYVAYSIKDDKVIYSIIPNEDYTLYTIYTITDNANISNYTYNMVDLGLPSGIKWADRNVGASSPEEYGSYFQWGNPSTYVTCVNSNITAAELAAIFDPDGVEITKDNIGELLKMIGFDTTDLRVLSLNIFPSEFEQDFSREKYLYYNSETSRYSKYNNEDNLTVLESSDDAAYIHMGSNYRMPTSEDIQELISNTTHIFVDRNGNEYNENEVNGAISAELGNFKHVKLISKFNNNAIIIPAAGYIQVSSNYPTGGISNAGVFAKLQSASLDDRDEYSDKCKSMMCNGGGGFINSKTYDYRYSGLPVRGVQS